MYDSRQILSYNEPAANWLEALPLGNGSIGAMHYCGVSEDKLCLNIDTLWSGVEMDKNNKSYNKHLDEIRNLIKNNNYEEAEGLIKAYILGDWTEAYLPLGDLIIEHDIYDYQAYNRELNLKEALTKTTYSKANILFVKEAFISNVDNVIVIKLTSSEDKLNLKFKLDSQLKVDLTSQNSELYLTGEAPIYAAPNYFECDEPIKYELGKGIRFAAAVEVINKKGSLENQNNCISITNTNEVIILASINTNYNKPLEYNCLEECKATLKRASSFSYDTLKKRHISEYQALYKDTTIELGQEFTNLDTLNRLKEFNKGNDDLSLISLLFNYGRYLLISCSRPYSQAANLQGIWNNKLRAPWSSNYTININTEMNYWIAEKCNLSKCHLPLFDLMDKMAVNGKKTAKEIYNIEGIVAHHNTDLWGHTSAVGGPAKNENPTCYAFWNMSFGWMCRHLWEHYLYTNDKIFLKTKAYPLIEGAVKFYLDYLTEYNGYLVTIPSTSPENLFKYSNGKPYAATIASTMDIAIIKELFNYYIEMCQTLDIDNDIVLRVKESLTKLPEYKIGKYGQLQEWFFDYDEFYKTHRHVSHLYGLYPSNQIDLDKTPDLANACKVSLNRRGDEGTGWSLAWKANLWARLNEGDRAFKLIKTQLRLITEDKASIVGGGIYPNLFCAHPPFQIDANFGLTAAVAEMLLQCIDGKIILLPALPKEWKTGKVIKLKAIGGFEISFDWKDYKIQNIDIKSDIDNSCILVYNNNYKELKFKSNEIKTIKM